MIEGILRKTIITILVISGIALAGMVCWYEITVPPMERLSGSVR